MARSFKKAAAYFTRWLTEFDYCFGPFATTNRISSSQNYSSYRGVSSRTSGQLLNYLAFPRLARLRCFASSNTLLEPCSDMFYRRPSLWFGQETCGLLPSYNVEDLVFRKRRIDEKSKVDRERNLAGIFVMIHFQERTGFSHPGRSITLGQHEKRLPSDDVFQRYHPIQHCPLFKRPERSRVKRPLDLTQWMVLAVPFPCVQRNLNRELRILNHELAVSVIPYRVVLVIVYLDEELSNLSTAMLKEVGTLNTEPQGVVLTLQINQILVVDCVNLQGELMRLHLEPATDELEGIRNGAIGGV